MSTEKIFAVVVISIFYILVSLIIGFIDVRSAYFRNEYWSTIPYGDLDYFYKDVKPKRIFGIHNIIFFPSLILILLAVIDTKRGTFEEKWIEWIK